MQMGGTGQTETGKLGQNAKDQVVLAAQASTPPSPFIPEKSARGLGNKEAQCLVTKTKGWVRK
jgi:hypothetical protein